MFGNIAILGHLADSVVAVEADEETVEEASTLLNDQGSDNVAVVCGPLEKGYPQEAPYDVIVLEGAVEEVPDGLLDQLKEGGRLVAIVQTGTVGKAKIFQKGAASVSERTECDAHADRLPGFEKAAPAFVF